MQRDNLTIAEGANRLLRESLKGTGTAHGDEAKCLAAQICEHARVVRHAADAVRDLVPYNLQAKMVVTEADRLVKEAESVGEQLSERGRYTGPRRSQMTLGEKAAYIKQHGEERFLSLPW
jgi:hypothetical protein